MTEVWQYKKGVHPSVWKEISRNNDVEIGLDLKEFTTIWDVLKWLGEEGWAESNSKLRHLLDGGGVTLNEKKLSFNDKIAPKSGDLLKVGKINFRVM